MMNWESFVRAHSNIVHTITPEHQSSEDNFDRKLPANISSYDHFWKTRRIIDLVQGETPWWRDKLFIRTNKNEELTITSEHPCSEYHFESKLQAKIYPSDHGFEIQEEELIDFKESKQMEPNKFSSEQI